MKYEIVRIDLSEVEIIDRIQANNFYELLNKLPSSDGDMPCIYISKWMSSDGRFVREQFLGIHRLRAWLESELSRVQ